MQDNKPYDPVGWHGTTIIGVKKGGEVVVAGDGQVSLGQTVIKATARKVRRLSPGGQDVVAGFAGSTADAFTLLERLEAKLEAAPGQLARACVDLAKDWRMDRNLRRLEAMLAVLDQDHLLVLSGTGDVIQPSDGLTAIGSGGAYALAAARPLAAHSGLDAAQIALSAAAVDGRVAVQHFAPEAAARHAEDVVTTRYRSEVAGDQHRAALGGEAAQQAPQPVDAEWV